MTADVAIWAHRGSSDPDRGISENTLEAFGRAGRLGADGIELDIRLTRDGAVVVHHSPGILGIGEVAALQANELPDHVPLLADVLDLCTGMTLNIEVKNLPIEAGYDPDETAARLVAGLVADAGLADGVIVSSFWPPTLEAAVDAVPAVPTGLLLAEWADPIHGLELARESGCRAVHPHWSRVTASLVDQAHAVGLSVNAWTVNDSATLVAVARCGVDTVITDDVSLMVHTLHGS
ncbi:MAG: glycerophosphodiester phosphodiesterase [Acidimicrobiales bacterium]